ncbi:hypothetical protein [Halorussus caseinilyticus]|nr:hypothetical protein [Halorussus sp. DT72]
MTRRTRRRVMRGRVLRWVAQVVGEPSDGKDWLVRKWRTLPILVRLGGWAVRGFCSRYSPDCGRG